MVNTSNRHVRWYHYQHFNPIVAFLYRSGYHAPLVFQFFLYKTTRSIAANTDLNVFVARMNSYIKNKCIIYTFFSIRLTHYLKHIIEKTIFLLFLNKYSHSKGTK